MFSVIFRFRFKHFSKINSNKVDLYLKLHMQNKQQVKSAGKKQEVQPANVSSLFNPIFQVKENHLSSTYEKILQYEQKNAEIQYLTKNTSIPKQLIQEQMKQPLIVSNSKVQAIFEKYGSLIENQPMFLRELIFNNYLPFLPQKFQNQFSQIMVIGSGFEALWWGSLAFMLFKGYKNRTIQISARQKINKSIGIGLIFLASSIGFHEHFYIPTIKECFYQNIKSVDSLMDRHINILKLSGSQIGSFGRELKQQEQLKAKNQIQNSSTKVTMKSESPQVVSKFKTPENLSK